MLLGWTRLLHKWWISDESFSHANGSSRFVSAGERPRRSRAQRKDGKTRRWSGWKTSRNEGTRIQVWCRFNCAAGVFERSQNAVFLFFQRHYPLHMLLTASLPRVPVLAAALLKLALVLVEEKLAQVFLRESQNTSNKHFNFDQPRLELLSKVFVARKPSFVNSNMH